MDFSSVVVTGGGTGGHLKVAKAFIDELYNRGINPIYIGSQSGADKEWFEHYIHLKKTFFLETKGVVNQGFLGKMDSLFKIIKETNRCLDIFEQYNVKRVISVGGYSAAPASFACAFSGAELFIHEQNSKMGSLNKISSKFAKEVFSSYDENSKVKDYPVEKEFFNTARVRREVNTVIFLGGSQGAKAINDYALKAAPKLKEKNINIIHQTGKSDFARIEKEYKKLNIQADVFAFSKELAQKMAKADFAVSRAGASTLWELTANALPTLFVPYPYAASDHQYYNAKFLKDKGLAFVKKQSELKQGDLFNAIQSNIHQISKSLVDEIMLDGIGQMVEVILSQ